MLLPELAVRYEVIILAFGKSQRGFIDDGVMKVGQERFAFSLHSDDASEEGVGERVDGEVFRDDAGKGVPEFVDRFCEMRQELIAAVVLVIESVLNPDEGAGTAIHVVKCPIEPPRTLICGFRSLTVMNVTAWVTLEMGKGDEHHVHVLSDLFNASWNASLLSGQFCIQDTTPAQNPAKDK